MQRICNSFAAFLFVICTTALYGQALTLSTSTLDFGELTVGEQADLALTLTNTSGEPLTITAINLFAIYLTNAFSVVSNPQLQLAANESTELMVRFEPEHNIYHNSELIISTSSGHGAVAVDLRGDAHYANPYYQSTYNLLDTDLKDALQAITGSGYTNAGYDAARDELFMVIENEKVNGQNAQQNTITRAYLGTQAVGFTSRQDAQGSPFNLNTEHTFPQGFFSQNDPMRSDLHHLMVTDIDANSERGNLPFGLVSSSISWQGGGSLKGLDFEGVEVFEPRDAQKGKTARAILYFLIRYQNYDGFVDLKQERILKGWSDQFEPGLAEVNRNQDIFEFQGNRNPFIDYPALAHRIYSFRSDEDRPDVGYLFVSTETVDFESVTPEITSTYSVILSNSGERFITINNLTISENATATYSLGTGSSETLFVQPGESIAVDVLCTAPAQNADLDALLTFTSNVTGTAINTLPITASTVTGLAAVGAQKLEVYPIPFQDELHLRGDVLPKQVALYDLQGRRVLQQNVNSGRLNTSSLAPGSYILHYKAPSHLQVTTPVVKSGW